MILISTIGIFINIKKDEAINMAGKLINFLKKKEIDYLVESRSADCLNEKDKKANFKELREKVDFVALFGGDGTLLRAAKHFAGSDIPLLGINIGSLGFMTVIEVEAVEKAIELILKDEYETENRMMLTAEVYRNNCEVYNGFGLNDVVINRGANFNLIGIELFINNQFVSSFKGDGLIVSTPTGSTAYSLSAGGPIIHPGLEVLVITPISPHNLYIRPLVIGGDDEVLADLEVPGSNMKISIDGRCGFDLRNGDQIKIRKSPQDVTLVKFPDRNFYRILREKMRIGMI
ncbi:MAG: NAD(+)/NADH kinase [Bacillota bacterium]